MASPLLQLSQQENARASNDLQQAKARQYGLDFAKNQMIVKQNIQQHIQSFEALKLRYDNASPQERLKLLPKLGGAFGLTDAVIKTLEQADSQASQDLTEYMNQVSKIKIDSKTGQFNQTQRDAITSTYNDLIAKHPRLTSFASKLPAQTFNVGGYPVDAKTAVNANISNKRIDAASKNVAAQQAGALERTKLTAQSAKEIAQNKLNASNVTGTLAKLKSEVTILAGVIKTNDPALSGSLQLFAQTGDLTKFLADSGSRLKSFAATATEGQKILAFTSLRNMFLLRGFDKNSATALAGDSLGGFIPSFLKKDSAVQAKTKAQAEFDALLGPTTTPPVGTAINRLGTNLPPQF